MSGTVPFLAERYTRRPETGHGPWETLRPGLTVVLGPDGNRRMHAASQRGTGKTRLAAAFAAGLWDAAELDLLVWLDAGSRHSILRGYARALADIKVAAPPGKPEAAASRFLTWLADTGKRWLVVLDGLGDAADAEGLWPFGENGQAVVTTTVPGLKPSPSTSGAVMPDAASTRDRAHKREQVSIPLPAFSLREAVNYLSDQLDGDPYQSAGALDLATATGCLPTALAVSVRYLLDTGENCRQYRLAWDRYRQAWAHDPRADSLAPSWMLAMERASQFRPAELLWPALKLAAVLGPAWIPGAVLTSSASVAYMTERLETTAADQAGVRAAYGNLERVGLVSIEPASDARTVHMPAALQASVRQVMGPAEIRRTVQAAADAICESWPEGAAAEGAAAEETEQALRDCATSLRRCDEKALWNPGCHPLLVRLGRSLDDARMPETAVGYWRDLAARCAGYVGARAPVTVTTRERLADAAMAAGRADEAIAVRQELAADIDELAGPAHPQAIASRASLAAALRAAGRLSDAITLGNRIASDSDRALGTASPQTTAILAELGRAYSDAGQYPGAVSALERCLGLRAQTMGLMHPETLMARHQLADAYRRAGQGKDAIRIYHEVVTYLDGTAGSDSPEAVTARESLAIAYYHAGLTAEAISTLERALAESRRVPGRDAASMIDAQANLAAIYCLSGRLREAIRLYEGEIADIERVRGAAHPDVFQARCNLAAAYHKAKRLPEAVQLGQATLADCEQALGPGHQQTLTLRANLAHAYHASGQLKRASAHFDRALRDCERALGPDDPLTGAVAELRKRYLAGRQGAAPIVTEPAQSAGSPRSRPRGSKHSLLTVGA